MFLASKRCSRCGEVKRAYDFHRRGADKLQSWCKDCQAARPARKRTVAERRRHRLKYRYDLTPEQYDEMLQAQNGVCAVCKQSADPLVVDHDHITSHIRGLLCTGCNLMLGHGEDDPARLRAAAEYLTAGGP